MIETLCPSFISDATLEWQELILTGLSYYEGPEPILIPRKFTQKSLCLHQGLRLLPEEPLEREGACPGGFYRYIDDEAEAIALLDYWADRQAWAAIDLETGMSWRYTPQGKGDKRAKVWIKKGLDPFTAPIMLCSVSVEPGRAVVFDMRRLAERRTQADDPLAIPYWVFSKRFRASFCRFLNSCRLIAHNATFEQSFFWAHFQTLGNMVYDTMLVNQLLTAGRKSGSDLGTMMSRYLGITLEKKYQRLFIEIHPDSPLPNDCIAYSAGDVCLLLEMAARVDKELRTSPMASVWDEIEQPLMQWMAEAKAHGLCIDPVVLKKLDGEMDERIAAVKEKLTALCPSIQNLNSTIQIAAWFKEQGAILEGTDEATLQKVIANQQGTPFAEMAALLLEFRGYYKLKTTYALPFLNDHPSAVTGRIHPTWKQLAAVTGRMSCIARGTLVEVVRDVSEHPKGIPIEDVKVGDLVYTFDEGRNLTLRPVVWSGKTGHKEIVRLHWQGDGHHTEGHIDLTPDHRVRLISGEYSRADALQIGDRVLSLSRGITCDYARLWATGHGEITREHRFIFETIYGWAPQAIHHVNENKLDNRVENLEPTTYSAHSKHHMECMPGSQREHYGQGSTAAHAARREELAAAYERGEIAPGYYSLTKEGMEKALWDNGGRCVALQGVLNVDEETVTKYVKKFSIDYRSIRRCFNGHGELITRDKVIAARKTYETRGCEAARKQIALGHYRWKEVQEAEGFIPYNHRITGVEQLNRAEDVYCLTVDETHNFIAGELCVANCSPGVQTLPSKGEFVWVRHAIVAEPGHLLCYIDLSQFEVRGLAELSGETSMIESFLEQYEANQALDHYCLTHEVGLRGPEVVSLAEKANEKPEAKQQYAALIAAHPVLGESVKHLADLDFHRRTASTLFGIPADEVTKDQRTRSKIITFAVPYGAGPPGIAQQASITVEAAADLLNTYYEKHPRVKQFLEKCKFQATRNGFTTTPCGRRRYYHPPRMDQVVTRLTTLRENPKKAAEWKKMLKKHDRHNTGDLMQIAESVCRAQLGAIEREGQNAPIQGCVHGSTRVFVENLGYVPIASLSGQPVSIWDGTGFSQASVVYSGKKQLVTVTLMGDHQIRCSPDHKFLVRNTAGTESWITAEELGVRSQNTRVALTLPPEPWHYSTNTAPVPRGRSWNAKALDLQMIVDKTRLGEWLGRIASDGCVTDTIVSLMVAEHEKCLLPALSGTTAILGHVGYGVRVTSQQPQPFYHLTVSSRGLAKQLRVEGIKDRIPTFVWADYDLLRSYLRGLFDGDGTVNQDGAVLTFGKKPDNIKWAHEVQEALLLLGIRSRVRHYVGDRTVVQVMKCDMPDFCRIVGFMNPRKHDKALCVTPGRAQGSVTYGRAAAVKSVEISSEWVDMYDVVDSGSGKFMANGIIVHNCNADVTKLATNIAAPKLKALHSSCAIIMWLHDEVVITAPGGVVKEAAEIMKAALVEAGGRWLKKVPIEVSVNISEHWGK